MGRGVALGALIAAGVLMLVPGVAAATARAARPLARTALRGGAEGAERLRRALADVYEHVEDLAAEVRADMENRPGTDHDAPEGPPSPDTADGSHADARSH